MENIPNNNEIKFIPINNDGEINRSKPANKIALETFLAINKELLDFEEERPGSYRDIINKGLVDYAEEQFKIWWNRVNKTMMYFKQKDKIICKELYDPKVGFSYNNYFIDTKILGKMENRFSKGRAEKVRKRMKWLCYKYKNSECVLLTLTIDPKRYNYDFIKISKIANKEFNRFMTNLKTHFKNKNRKFPEWIKSPEFMIGRPENNYISKGLIHFHICFLGANRLLDWREIKKLWKIGHIWINRTKDKKKIRKPIDYITKYITKSVDIKNKKMLTTQAMNWIFNIRNYSCKRGLVYPLCYKKEVPDFDLKVGIEFKNDLENYKDDFLKKVINHVEKFGM